MVIEERGRKGSSPDISVVIPHKNRFNTLKLVLEGFEAQSLSPERFQVIISDSGSSEEERERLREWLRSSRLNYKLIVDEDRGRAGARNDGITYSDASLIVFTDADIIPSRDFLKEHLNFHSSGPPHSALLGIEVRVTSEEELREAMDDPEGFLMRRPERASRKHRRFRKVQWWKCITGNLSVKRKHLIQAGLFDTNLDIYGYEDIELGYRLHRIGVNFFLHPKLYNFHLHPYSLKGRIRTARAAGKNLAKFFAKHGDRRIPLVFGINPFNSMMARLKGLLWRLVGEEDVEASSHELTGLAKLAFELIVQAHKLEAFYEELNKR